MKAKLKIVIALIGLFTFSLTMSAQGDKGPKGPKGREDKKMMKGVKT